MGVAVRRTTGWTSRLWALAVMTCVAASCSGAGSTASSSSPLSARIVSVTPVRGRLQDIVVHSPAVRRDVRVRVLLPSAYANHRARRWPVLYLLHGCCDTQLSWMRSTDIERLSRSLPALVVMPDGGPVGFYSDWLHGPGWETFHTAELPRVLAARYRTSGPAVIAGVSMGGLGALDYAARHPGMFSAAASFSGIVDTRLSDGESEAYVKLVSSQGADPNALWGDPISDAEVWRAHNPYDLAPRLKGVALFVSAGNGQPGPLDRAGSAADPTEASIGDENAAFAHRLRALGLHASIDLYGPGTHNWVYWQRELNRAWPLITRALGRR